MQESAGTDARAAYEAGLAASGGVALPTSFERPIHAFTLPWGARLSLVNMERFTPNPYRARGTARTHTVHAFVAYVKNHWTSATTVWVSIDEHRAVAVLNDHTAVVDGDPDTRQPGWGDHRAELAFKTTPEWDFWTSHDGHLYGQEAFAEHLEEGAKEVVNPDAATMLEIAQSFHAKNEVTFRSATRLDSGQTRFMYDEALTAQAGKKGDMQVPTSFELGISPFQGEAPYRVSARLRWRLRDGKLSIGYKLDRPHDVIRDAMEKVADRLTGEFSQVYMGSPREPHAVAPAELVA